MSKFLVVKKFFENSNNGNLPYDAEIEYLEGNGTQYISTGLKINNYSGYQFENIGSGSFVLGPDTKVIEPEIPEENQPTSKFIVGKRFTNITDFVNPNFSLIKKHFETKFQLNFDTDGGNVLEPKEVVLGKSYGELPIPTKAQNIFIGWFTNASGGTQITSESIASLDINILYAHWEYIQIDSSNCTSYSVTTNSSYRNTGIHTASIADSSQPIYIDWGDGTVEKTTSSISQKSHTYSSIGNFTVKISDNITSFAPSYNNSTWYGTTSQNRYTFKGMISTGSKVTSLPTYAFYYCQAMTNIDFMETCWPTVTSLPNYCFQYCSGLTSIQGAKRFTSLGSYCFQYCSGLTGIQDLSEFKFTTLSNSYTFANCTNVTQWILPSGFNGTSFGSYMFSNNSSLVAVGNIEKTINQIKVVQIDYLETIGSQCIDTKLNIQSTDNLRIVFDFQFLTRKTNGKNQYIFSTTNNWLSFEVDINSPYHAYANIGSTTGISWTQTTIPYNQWIHCDYNINAQNKTIDITGWQNINSSYSGSHGTGTFYICSQNNSNYVDNGVIAKFKPMQIYMNDILVRDLIPVRVGNIGYMYDKVSGQLFENSGTGNFILGPDKTDAEEIIIEQEIMVSKLPTSLTSTGTYTFQNCSNLNNIIIPSNVQSIEQYTFYGCTMLNNVSIEATNLTAINQYAFYNCNKLTDLDLPDTVKTIGNYAFYGCTSLDYAGRKVEISDPLCFTANEPGASLVFGWYNSNNEYFFQPYEFPLEIYKFQYSSNLIDWNEYIIGTPIELDECENNKVYFRADPTHPNIDVIKDINLDGAILKAKCNGFYLAPLNTVLKFQTYGSIAASGNINYLLDATGNVKELKHAEILESNYPNIYPTGQIDTPYFMYMFMNCEHLTQAPELPATTLVERCYYNMFEGCTSLTQAPKLPATTLANNCYDGMFWNCTSLTQAPALPATTLANSCYSEMFECCTSLTQAPALPATTLASNCYQYMFYGCTALTQAPALPATTLANSCYTFMFYNCTSLTQASFQNLEKETVVTEVVENQGAFYNAASDIEATCKDGILVINSTSA